MLICSMFKKEIENALKLVKCSKSRLCKEEMKVKCHIIRAAEEGEQGGVVANTADVVVLVIENEINICCSTKKHQNQ